MIIGKNVQNFLLLEYAPSTPAEIRKYDIMKVQRKGRGRYMPFVVSLNDIIVK